LIQAYPYGEDAISISIRFGGKSENLFNSIPALADFSPSKIQVYEASSKQLISYYSYEEYSRQFYFTPLDASL